DAYTKADDAVRGKTDQLFANPRSENPQLSLDAYVSSQLKSNIEKGGVALEKLLVSWAADFTGISSTSDLSLATTFAKGNLDAVKVYLEDVSLAVNVLLPNSNLTQTTIDRWKTDVGTARTNVNTATANLTTAQTNVKTEEADFHAAQGDLNSATDELALKKAPARPADIALYEAQIAQAQASAENSIVQLAKKQINSPIDGVITDVPAKVGSILAANETAVSLISKDTLEIESYIPELHIPFIRVGDMATVALDAYGNETPFMAHVISIDPAETVRDGVSTYRVRMQFLAFDERGKPGMTANVRIITERKSNVLTVPQGIVIHKDGKKFLLVKEGDLFREREVETGGVSFTGQVEITSGLKDGDVVVLKQTE
ncbi:MAG: RND family efflux transporter MFP subunit, partial [Parcubacteria group bacterium Gr01-1014_70]